MKRGAFQSLGISSLVPHHQLPMRRRLVKVEFLEKERPVFTRALVEPWRLVCLGFGLILLCVGSHMTPSVDWDYPISFIMGIWAYVFAP